MLINTIGYEGARPDDFVETLRAADVTMVIDIRDRAQSRRPGFSKSALEQSLAEAGIGYVHYRELGDATARGETLTLIKPSEVTLSWTSKSDAALEEERRKHAELVRQISMFDNPAKPLEPCPFEFKFKWKTEQGASHEHTCDDWETSTAFFRRRERHGEVDALKSLKLTYEEDYLRKGMRFALGTHSRRDQQWLLVGVLRVDDQAQQELPI